MCFRWDEDSENGWAGGAQKPACFGKNQKTMPEVDLVAESDAGTWLLAVCVKPVVLTTNTTQRLSQHDTITFTTSQRVLRSAAAWLQPAPKARPAEVHLEVDRDKRQERRIPLVELTRNRSDQHVRHQQASHRNAPPPLQAVSWLVQDEHLDRRSHSTIRSHRCTSGWRLCIVLRLG